MAQLEFEPMACWQQQISVARRQTHGLLYSQCSHQKCPIVQLVFSQLQFHVLMDSSYQYFSLTESKCPSLWLSVLCMIQYPLYFTHSNLYSGGLFLFVNSLLFPNTVFYASLISFSLFPRPPFLCPPLQLICFLSDSSIRVLSVTRDLYPFSLQITLFSVSPSSAAASFFVVNVSFPFPFFRLLFFLFKSLVLPFFPFIVHQSVSYVSFHFLTFLSLRLPAFLSCHFKQLSLNLAPSFS